MKNITVFILIILFSISVIAQTSQTTPRNPKKPASAKNLANEKEEFDKAVALTDTTERIAALRKFVEDFPKSKEKNRASELITSARAALADEKFRSGAKAESIELFELAVRETPKPVSDKLYTEIILQIPNSLFFRGERAAANDIAGLIEEKADGNAQQMLALAAFHIGLENVAEAKRLADKAIFVRAESACRLSNSRCRAPARFSI
jgi:tetratricopeptide (TPR) repeat protein